MQQLLATGEEELRKGNFESGIKQGGHENLNLNVSHGHPKIQYLSTGVGVAAIIGSKESASELGLFLYQQYGPSLPPNSCDDFLHAVKTGTAHSPDLIALFQKSILAQKSEEAGRASVQKKFDCRQPTCS